MNEIYFETLEISCLGPEQKGDYVIKDDSHLKDFYQTLQPDNSRLSQLPKIDFTKEMIIAVARGECPSTDYTTKIEKLKEEKDSPRGEILEVFVEKENPFEVTDYYNDKHHPESAQAGDEIKLLYHWWKEGRFVEELEHKKNKNKPDWDYFGIYERETEMLIRLINIRRYLWT